MIERSNLPFTSGKAAIAALESSEISAVELVQHCISEIEAKNPKINALREVFSSHACEQAAIIDSEKTRNVKLATLSGLPLVMKENIDTPPGICSAGLSFRRNYKPKVESWIVSKIRESGGVIVGLSISDPGAFGTKTEEVRHPGGMNLSVGGSSGGTAAAIASGFCYGGVGTDTGGSIRIPSACCATVGLKPTRGRFPMEGILPLVESLDHVGPMASNVSDVELLYRCLVHGLPREHIAKPVLKVGYDYNYFKDAQPTIRDNFREFIESIKGLGIAVEKVVLPSPSEVLAVHRTVFCTEAAAYHLSHFGEYEKQYPPLAQSVFEHARTLGVDAYISACRRRMEFTRAIDRCLTHVNLLLTPTLPISSPLVSDEGFWFEKEWQEFDFAMVRYTSLFNHTGHPVLALPLSPAVRHTAPSIQIVGASFEELTVLCFGQILETHINAVSS